MQRHQSATSARHAAHAKAIPAGAECGSWPWRPTGDAQTAWGIGGFAPLFVSGQVPANDEGHVPADYRSQYRLAWANVEAQLKAAGMTFDNLVKVTICLSDRALIAQSAGLRKEILGELRRPSSILRAGIYERPGCWRSKPWRRHERTAGRSAVAPWRRGGVARWPRRTRRGYGRVAEASRHRHGTYESSPTSRATAASCTSAAQTSSGRYRLLQCAGSKAAGRRQRRRSRRRRGRWRRIRRDAMDDAWIVSSRHRGGDRATTNMIREPHDGPATAAAAIRELAGAGTATAAGGWPTVIVTSRHGGHGQGDIYIATPSSDGGWRVDNIGAPNKNSCLRVRSGAVAGRQRHGRGRRSRRSFASLRLRPAR